MDLESAGQRSASQGSLHSAYKAHDRAIVNSQSLQTCRRRALRSTNDNANLLRSPGPLESMLKTTTETGDIGFFSIKPACPPATYHQPPRARIGLGDANLLQASRSKSYGSDMFHDDRQRLPSSYRDTTSEILSLYGSEAPRSYSRSFSPSLDDTHRSYSLTTCSSRHIPSQKSSATLQSQRSGACLQRPRSPFPYPTRLKRPGVRPASPALTESGSVDYSRRVELDHTSQRTIHASFRPTYTHCPRRPPPLSLRPEASRSASSLPSRVSQSPYHTEVLPYRPRTPKENYARTQRASDTSERSSTNQSLKSHSLTSIVEMYQRPTRTSRTDTDQQSAGSFYYDYTEEFERRPSPVTEGRVPVCPIPKRATKIRCPMVLRNEAHSDVDKPNFGSKPGDYHAFLDDPDSDSTLYNARTIIVQSPGAHESSSRAPLVHEQPTKTENPPRRIDPEFKSEHLDQSTPTCGKGTPIRHGEPKAIERDEDRSNTSPESEGFECDKSMFDVACVPCPSPETSQESKSVAESSSKKNPSMRHLPDLALETLDSSCPEPICSENPSRLLDNDVEGPAVNELQQTNQVIVRVPSPASRQSSAKRRSSSTSPFKTTDNGFYRKKHRRNCAALAIDTGILDHETQNTLAPTESYEKHAILSPEPVSPLRQLKVKNSIPQLMKALPPLPSSVDWDIDMKAAQSTGEHPGDDERNKKGLVDGNSMNLAETLEQTLEKEHSHESTPPKFKVRLKSNSPERIADHRVDVRSQPDITQNSVSLANRKLKIKVSHPAVRASRQTSIPQRFALKQCHSVADLDRQPSGADAASCTILEARTALEAPCYECTDTNALIPVEYDVRPASSPQPSDQFDLQYPPSPNILKEGEEVSTSQFQGATSSSDNGELDSTRGSDAGLRQKLSFLRLRVVGSQRGKTVVPLRINEEPLADHETMPKASSKPKSTKQAASTRYDETGGRVLRWARDARRIVRSCVRRTLDRSTMR